MKLIEYAAWSRRSRGATPRTHPVGRIQGVTFHWEGPHMGAFPHSNCDDKVRGIQAFHRDGRGWADIAYNALVCPHGYIYEGRGPNTASAANGYATANATWYAVCYLGGERDPFTAEAKQGFRDAVAWLRREGNAGPGINGHRDHKATACPGDTIYRWLKSGDAQPTTKDDDMPLTDDDLDKIAYRVWAKEIGGGDNRKAARLHVIQAANASLRNEANKLDPQALAAAIVAALPSGRIDEATVVSGVKKALADVIAGLGSDTDDLPKAL